MGEEGELLVVVGESFENAPKHFWEVTHTLFSEMTEASRHHLHGTVLFSKLIHFGNHHVSKMYVYERESVAQASTVSL